MDDSGQPQKQAQVNGITDFIFYLPCNVCFHLEVLRYQISVKKTPKQTH